MGKFIKPTLELKSNHPDFNFDLYQVPSDLFIDFDAFIDDDNEKTLFNICRFISESINIKNKSFKMLFFAVLGTYAINKKDDVNFDDLTETVYHIYQDTMADKASLPYIFGENTNENFHLTLSNMDRLGREWLNKKGLLNI
jgi:hypothetical protein